MTRRISFLRVALASATATGLLAVSAAAETHSFVPASDAKMIRDSAQDSLEFDETLETTKWVNPDTGNSGTITPTETYETAEGQYCREYYQTVMIGGVEQEAYGSACRRDDGSWEIARDEPEVRPDSQPAPADAQNDEVVVEEEPTTVIYRDRVVYVPRRRPRYGYPVLYPAAVSIGIGIDDGQYGYYGYGPDYWARGPRHRVYRRGLTVRRGHRHGVYYRVPYYRR